MAKQKKGKTISNLDKTIGRVVGIETQNPSEFRMKISDFMEQYKSYAEAFGLTGNPSAKPHVRKEDLEFYHDICKEENATDYICATRTLLAGYWYTHRVVYTFTEETLDFLDKEMDIDNFRLNISTLQRAATEEPILIELPPGYPIQKAFLGRVSFFSEATGKASELDTLDFCIFASLVKKEKTLALIGASADMPVSQYIQSRTRNLDGHDEEVCFLTRLVVYIAYMKGMQDTKDAVFVEEPIKNGVRFKVLPAHAESPTADESCETGWIRAGLAPVMGYYDRMNMIRDFSSDLSARSPEKSSCDIDDTDASMRAFLEKVVLSWESNRNLYGFNNELALSAALDMVIDVLSSGISSDLLDYMPYNVMAFYPTESNAFMTALISRCSLKGGRRGVYLIVLTRPDECSSVCYFGEDEPLIEGKLERWSEEIDADAALVLGIFKYTLTILRRKALRKMNSSGQPNPPNPNLPEKKLPIPSAPIIRQGGDISDIIPIAMYDLTKRAIKRVPRKEEARRSGWKMTPHTRRRHPHRYWVGSGENRRQEIRWLESIHINKQSEDAVPAVTVHEVK